MGDLEQRGNDLAQFVITRQHDDNKKHLNTVMELIRELAATKHHLNEAREEGRKLRDTMGMMNYDPSLDMPHRSGAFRRSEDCQYIAIPNEARGYEVKL